MGKVIVIGLWAGCLLVMGAFSTRKWAVASESDMAYLIDLVTLGVLKIASACGNSYKLLACAFFCHALFLVGMVGFFGWMISLVGVMHASSWDDSSLLVNSSAVAVVSTA